MAPTGSDVVVARHGWKVLPVGFWGLSIGIGHGSASALDLDRHALPQAGQDQLFDLSGVHGLGDHVPSRGYAQFWRDLQVDTSAHCVAVWWMGVP